MHQELNPAPRPLDVCSTAWIHTSHDSQNKKQRVPGPYPLHSSSRYFLSLPASLPAMQPPLLLTNLAEIIRTVFYLHITFWCQPPQNHPKQPWAQPARLGLICAASHVVTLANYPAHHIRSHPNHNPNPSCDLVSSQAPLSLRFAVCI